MDAKTLERAENFAEDLGEAIVEAHELETICILGILFLSMLRLGLDACTQYDEETNEQDQ